MSAPDLHTPAGYITAMLRREKVSQKEAAERLGISAAYLCDMLNGRRRIGPGIVELVVDCIETQDKIAARADLHRLGSEADGWAVGYTQERLDVRAELQD